MGKIIHKQVSKQQHIYWLNRKILHITMFVEQICPD